TSTSPNAEMANSMPGAALDTTTDHERRHLVIHSDSKNVHSRFAAACWRPYPASRDRIAAS
ncbi:hypothetical protein, partial [Parafannyhessea umbonata]|uniref:hypothetical protein n=1 Tax=Parafannyhessea umbonata TaxID=604330 RepID=UPI001C40B3B9